MTDNGPPRVLVVDDHDLFRSGLRRLLEEEGFEVADARSGDAALATLEWFEADVILMDLNLPGMSGIEATSRALEVQPSASVVILTLARDEASIIQAVRAGAAGYLLKDARLEEIVGAIRAAASGHSVLGNAAAQAVMAYIRAAPTIPAAPALAMLSEREREVLVLIAGGCDNTTIGERLFMSPSTVKHHVSRILQKLGVGNRLQAAAVAIRHGLPDGGESPRD